MKKKMKREEKIKLISSDYGFSEDITSKLKTEVLRNVCNSSQPHIYLKSLIELNAKDIYL